MSTNIWNFAHPLRTGHINLVTPAEFFGTVIKTGHMKKTITVLVTRYRYVSKMNKIMSRGKKFHCHDEFNECRIGDKVVIKCKRGISNIKHFYVRQVVLPIGRHNYYATGFSQDEKEAMAYNEKLRREKINIY